MDTTRKQCTIAEAVSVEGVGYWSGRDIRVEFRPADADTGLVFVREDLPGCPQIAATVDNRIDIPLRSSLECGGAGVDMVEHVLAALGGLRIDNCEIRVDAAEMPGRDGSSLPFVEALDAAGRVVQDAPRRRAVVRDLIRATQRGCRIEACPSQDDGTTLEYHLDYADTSIGRQSMRLVLTPETFRRELAPSRTFLLEAEARRLMAQGLGRRASFRDLLVFGPDGPIDNTLRFPDECVRHKLLDMVGDLTLAGCDLIGCFTAWRSGHHLNAQLVRMLVAKGQSIGRYRRCA
ncbi:MAG: UDP-3-O-acyl-N-acetylglucosamine deacetylase [Planctomycetia bacterium]|nr:UDP-3-O-acyl-N-acetylglucosamine deacetylase [Planctomycetia bacterium]